MVVARADHLVVDDDVDALVAMPMFTLSVVDHRNVNNLFVEENNDINVSSRHPSQLREYDRGKKCGRSNEYVVQQDL